MRPSTAVGLSMIFGFKQLSSFAPNAVSLYSDRTPYSTVRSSLCSTYPLYHQRRAFIESRSSAPASKLDFLPVAIQQDLLIFKLFRPWLHTPFAPFSSYSCKLWFTQIASYLQYFTGCSQFCNRISPHPVNKHLSALACPYSQINATVCQDSTIVIVATSE